MKLDGFTQLIAKKRGGGMDNIKYHGALVALRLILLFLNILRFLKIFSSNPKI